MALGWFGWSDRVRVILGLVWSWLGVVGTGCVRVVRARVSLGIVLTGLVVVVTSESVSAGAPVVRVGRSMSGLVSAGAPVVRVVRSLSGLVSVGVLVGTSSVMSEWCAVVGVACGMS